MTAFLVSGIAGTVPGVVGEPYRDGSGNEYLPMFVQPVLVYAAHAAGLQRAYERAMSREVMGTSWAETSNSNVAIAHVQPCAGSAGLAAGIRVTRKPMVEAMAVK